MKKISDKIIKTITKLFENFSDYSGTPLAFFEKPFKVGDLVVGDCFVDDIFCNYVYADKQYKRICANLVSPDSDCSGAVWFVDGKVSYLSKMCILGQSEKGDMGVTIIDKHILKNIDNELNKSTENWLKYQAKLQVDGNYLRKFHSWWASQTTRIQNPIEAQNLYSQYRKTISWDEQLLDKKIADELDYLRYRNEEDRLKDLAQYNEMVLLGQKAWNQRQENFNEWQKNILKKILSDV